MRNMRRIHELEREKAPVRAQKAQCEGKERFQSPNLAHKVAGRRRHGEWHEHRQPYRCKFCGFWHIGRPT